MNRSTGVDHGVDTIRPSSNGLMKLTNPVKQSAGNEAYMRSLVNMPYTYFFRRTTQQPQFLGLLGRAEPGSSIGKCKELLTTTNLPDASKTGKQQWKRSEKIRCSPTTTDVIITVAMKIATTTVHPHKKMKISKQNSRHCYYAWARSP